MSRVIGVPDLGVAAGGAAGEAELDAFGLADWVAVRVESADGEVPVVEVHAHDRPSSAHAGTWCLKVGARCLGFGGPGGGEVHAGASRACG